MYDMGEFNKKEGVLMKNFLKSAVLALVLVTSVATVAQAQEHGHGGDHGGRYYDHGWHGYGYPHWHGPIVAGRYYPAYPYPYGYYPPAYYPAPAPVYPAYAPAYAAPGVSVGIGIR